MGTSGSYGGSGGGNWGGLQDGLDDWLDSLPGSDDGDEDDGAPPAEGPQGADKRPDRDPEPESPAPAVVEMLRPLGRAILSGGRGTSDGPSAGGGLGTGGVGGGGGGRSPSGTARSRARVGRVGGRLAAGISGLGTADAAALQDLGLNLAELQTLNPYRQAQRLLEAATEEGVATTLEEEELQTAANRTALWALTADIAPDVDDVLRRFIVEYVYEVFLTEGGSILRSGQRDGVNSARAEDRVKDTIVALVRAVPIERTGVGAAELAEVVERVLSQTLRIHGTAA